eukprot:1368507-Pleurochrysis_carterae.AAC.1
MGAVFAELNKGEGVTAGLKHVKKGEGLKDRPVPVPKTSAAPTAAPKATPAAAKPPKFALENKKWLVEHQARRDVENFVKLVSRCAEIESMFPRATLMIGLKSCRATLKVAEKWLQLV